MLNSGISCHARGGVLSTEVDSPSKLVIASEHVKLIFGLVYFGVFFCVCGVKLKSTILNNHFLWLF